MDIVKSVDPPLFPPVVRHIDHTPHSVFRYQKDVLLTDNWDKVTCVACLIDRAFVLTNEEIVSYGG